MFLTAGLLFPGIYHIMLTRPKSSSRFMLRFLLKPSVGNFAFIPSPPKKAPTNPRNLRCAWCWGFYLFCIVFWLSWQWGP